MWSRLHAYAWNPWTQWPCPKWGAWCVFAVLQWLVSEVYETLRFWFPFMAAMYPQCSLVLSLRWCRLLPNSLCSITSPKCGLGGRTQGQHLGQGRRDWIWIIILTASVIEILAPLTGIYDCPISAFWNVSPLFLRFIHYFLKDLSVQH